MVRAFRALGIVATLALVGYAVVLLMFGDDVEDAVEGAIVDGKAAAEQSSEVEQRRERLGAVARGLAAAPRQKKAGPQTLSVEVEVPAPAIAYGSGELDIEEVRQGFVYAMDRVDAVVASRKRISVADWDVLYREANDAYSALSIVLDASQEDQLAELEAAHVRLKKGLKRVRVRGRKFGT